MRKFSEEAGEFGNKEKIWRLIVGEAMGRRTNPEKHKVRRGKMKGPWGKFPSLRVKNLKTETEEWSERQEETWRQWHYGSKRKSTFQEMRDSYWGNRMHNK